MNKLRITKCKKHSCYCGNGWTIARGHQVIAYGIQSQSEAIELVT